MIHSTSDVQTKNIGDGTNIWQFCVVLENAIIGSHCNINSHVFIENDVIIGNHVTIKSGVQIWDGLRIEDSVFVGPNVTFTNDIYPRSKHYPLKFKKTIIRQGASLGANSTIIAGNIIGSYCLIGAGSVIVKDIPDFTLWYGNPAIHHGYVTKNSEIINMDLIDKQGRLYHIIDGEPILA